MIRNNKRTQKFMSHKVAQDSLNAEQRPNLSQGESRCYTCSSNVDGGVNHCLNK